MSWSTPGVLMVERLVLVVGGVLSLGAMVAVAVNILTGSQHGEAQR